MGVSSVVASDAICATSGCLVIMCVNRKMLCVVAPSSSTTVRVIVAWPDRRKAGVMLTLRNTELPSKTMSDRETRSGFDDSAVIVRRKLVWLGPRPSFGRLLCR